MKLFPCLQATLAAVILPLFFVACDGPVEGDEGEGERGGEEGEGEPGDVSDAQLADAFLAAADRCNLFGNLEELEPVLAASSGLQFTRERLLEQLSESRANTATEFDNDAAVDCLADLQNCDSLLSSDSVCNAIFVGIREDGEGCGNANECVDGLTCFQVGFTCGTCQAKPGLGASCDSDPAVDDENRVDCADGLKCIDADGNGSVCVTALALGATCDDFEDACGDGLFCDEDALECVAVESNGRLALGDACTTDCGGVTTGLACVNDACVAITVAQPGQPCDASFQNPTVWCINTLGGINTCLTVGGAPTGVCTALPAAGGGACVAGACAADAVCNEADACVAPPGAGQACIDFECAEGFLCEPDTELCVAAPVAGETCIDFECADGFSCLDDETCAADAGVGESCLDVQCEDNLDCGADDVCFDSSENLVCAE